MSDNPFSYDLDDFYMSIDETCFLLLCTLFYHLHRLLLTTVVHILLFSFCYYVYLCFVVKKINLENGSVDEYQKINLVPMAESGL
jgi:hypothetical protein